MATPASTNAAILPGNLRFSAGGIYVADLIGTFIKSVTAAGLVTYQDANGVEQTRQLAVGGSAITGGTADPTGGSAGDAYIQINGSDQVTALWWNDSGTWTEYAITGSGGGSGASITSGTADPTGGSAGDAYLQVDSSDVLQSIWRNVSGTWTEYALPSGGPANSLNSIAFPTPTVSNVYDIVDHFGQAFANIPEAISPVVTWDPSGDGDDVSDLWNEQSGTYRFRGIQLTSSVSSPLSGDIVLLPTGSFRQRGATRWSHLGNPVGWRGGPYANADEANHHVLAANDVSAFDNALQLATAFTAGTTHYAWMNIAEVTPPSALVSRVLGTPTVGRLYEIQDFLGELYRVEPRPTGHVVTWDDYALLSDVSTLWGEGAGTYRWRGETYPSGVINPATGDVIKEPAGHFRHRNSSNAWVHLVDPDDFIGDFNDEAAADNHVTAVGQTSLYSHNLHQVATFTVGTPNYVWAKGLDAREVTTDASRFTLNLGDTDTDLQTALETIDQLIVGSELSDEDPEDVGAAAAPGTQEAATREGHAHRLPTDSTLEFNANDELAVNVQDVIEHLQERIQYHTASNNYSSDAGATVGQAYQTSQYRKIITKVEVLLNPLVGADGYLVRLDELNSDNSIKAKLFTSNTRSAPFGLGVTARSFTFHNPDGDVGVIIDGSIRLGVLISRIGDNSDSAVAAVHGSEVSAGPRESYDDASVDFDLENDVVYQHINPGVGQSTHSHGTDIRGNIKIFYTLIIDHGSLVGAPPELTQAQVEDETNDTFGLVSGERLSQAVAEFESPDGGGGGGGGYGDWAAIGSVTGAISGNPVTVALNSGETIDDYEDLYIHIEANDTNDQRVVSGRFRASDVPTTTLAGGGLGIPFAGNNTDEGAILVRRNADGDSLVLDPYGSVINFPATAVTTIYARELTTGGGGGGGTDDQTAAEVSVDTANFSSNLTATDDTVQAALETIDGFTQYQGAWQQASWPAGVIVTRSGIAYISLVNNNTEIPTPASTQWAGLTEGFTYRGEAPVAATNYNYGHVVKNPDTGSYYYFISTISASVARADIATHANFQAIAGETGHSPRVGSGNAFPTTPAPLAGDIFFFNADVASGLDWKDTDGTADLTAATSGDMARFDGTDWIKVINLVGGGGAAPDRIVLADAVGVSNTAGPHEIALTEAMVPRQWLSFFVFTTAGASPDGIGYLLSDDILALTAEATAPTDAENALPVLQASYSASNFTQQSGNYFVFRKDDSTLWIRPTRLAAHALTITATPMGGGGGTAGQQLAGGLTEQVIVGSRLATTEYGLGTLWTAVVDAISPTISPPIDPDNLLQIAVGLRIDTEAAPELIISGAGIRRVTHTNDPLPSTAVSSDEIPGAYYSARVPQNNEDRVIEINPTLSWMEKRRQAGRYGVLFAFTDDAAGNLTSIRPFVSAAVEIDIEYIIAIVGT